MFFGNIYWFNFIDSMKNSLIDNVEQFHYYMLNEKLHDQLDTFVLLAVYEFKSKII